MGPGRFPTYPDQSRSLPELRGIVEWIFQALFDLNSFSGFDLHAFDADVTNGSAEGLVTAALCVKHILADDFPICEPEHFFVVDFICVGQAVEDEPDAMSAERKESFGSSCGVCTCA